MAKLLQGEELKANNEAVRKKNPRVLTMLEWCLCCYCIHRGKYRGCSFGLVPLTIDNTSCPYLRTWGPWTLERVKKEAGVTIKASKNGG